MKILLTVDNYFRVYNILSPTLRPLSSKEIKDISNVTKMDLAIYTIYPMIGTTTEAY